MSAVCTVHSGDAKGTCERCGAFVCSKCVLVGNALCPSCTQRLDGEPLEAAIAWVSQRVFAVKVGVGAGATFVGVGASLFAISVLRSGRVGGLASAAILALCIWIARQVTNALLRRLTPNWISRAQARFKLHEEVLRELRIVLG